MARLIYASIMSLDGYSEDDAGGFGWAEPDEEVHAFINDAEREVGTYLFGRRMYETMAVWETDPSLPATSPLMREYAELWKAADKIVYSSTLGTPRTSKTRIERRFDPGMVRVLKEEAKRDLAIGGPTLAAHAFAAGLVDECHLYVVPVVVGRGKAALPLVQGRRLELLEERRFGRGTVHVKYRVPQ